MNTRLTWILILTLVLAAMPAAGATDVRVMEVDTLKNLLGDAEIIVLDVRTGPDWSSSELKIKGAQRTDPRAFDTWSADLDRSKTIVLYCA